MKIMSLHNTMAQHDYMTILAILYHSIAV